MSGDRCILWNPRGRAPDPELMAALAGKGLTVEVCHNAYEALALVCVASRKRSAEAPAGSLVLVFSDPPCLERAGEVSQLVGRYAKPSASWLFEPLSRVLRAVNADDTARWSAVAARARVAGRGAGGRAGGGRGAGSPGGPAIPQPPGGAPALRLSGEGKLPPLGFDEADATPDKAKAGTASDGDGQNGPGNLLSNEELEMLLSPDRPARED